MSSRQFLRCVVAFNLLLIVFTVAHGLLKTGNPSRYFGEHRYTTYISSAQLLTIGVFAFLTFRKRRQVVAPEAEKRGLFRSPVLVWLLIASGFAFLAVDEVAELHERMDKVIVKALDLPRTPLTERIDDAILASYGLIGLAVLWICRREILPFRRVMLKPLAAGFVCLFIGVLCDTAAHDDHFFHWLTGDLAAAKALNGWFSAAEGAFTLLPEGLFLAAFYAAWKNAERIGGEGKGLSLL